MKGYFILVLAMVVTVVFVPPVTAGWISQSVQYDFGSDPGASSFQEYMGFNFDPFDDLGGTLILERVTLMYGITASAHVTVENDTEYFMDTVIVTSSVHLDIDNFGVASPVDMSEDEWMISLEASDGVSGSGPDFYDYGILSIDGIGYFDTTYNTSELSRFIGSDPVQLVFDGSAEFAIGGETWRPFLTVSDLAASMNASLTYEYVPEPTTLMLLGLGAIVLRNKHKN